MATQFKIEKGVPVPTRHPGRNSPYPFDEMEIGESFFVATEARAAIAAIDKLIDANRAELLSRCTRKPKHWLTWGHAWERNPDLAARDHELFRQRGEAQLIRDNLEAREAARAAAAESRRYASQKPRKCPTCGVASFAA